jgi:hypothetical protein
METAHCCSKKESVLCIIKHVLPPDSLSTLYFALIHPHLSYGITVWGNADQNVIIPLMLVQKRAIRVINNASYYSHTGPKFKKSGILQLHDLFHYQSLLFMHDYISNKLPNSFNGCFPTNSDMPCSRITRQSKYCTSLNTHWNTPSDNLLVFCPHCGISGLS